jgi:hypothetical protein
MEIYLVTYIEPFRGTICRIWCADEAAAHARAAKLRAALQDRRSLELEIERIEFPTEKAEVIEWLNANCYR